MSTRDDDSIAATIHDLLTSIGENTAGSGVEGSGVGQRIQDFRDALDTRIEAEISDTEMERKLLEIKMEAARRAVLRDHQSGSTALQAFLTLSAVTDREKGGPRRRPTRTPCGADPQKALVVRSRDRSGDRTAQPGTDTTGAGIPAPVV